MILREAVEAWGEPYKTIFNVLRRFFARREFESFRVERMPDTFPKPVQGCVVYDNATIYFREIPPPPEVFTHELIHLCKKPEFGVEIGDEFWAYNVTNVAMFIVESGLGNCVCNPFCPFTLGEKDVVKVLNRFGIESIEEYFRVIGVIPPTELFEPYVGDRGRAETLAFVVEAFAGYPYFRLTHDILYNLMLEYCCSRCKPT